MFVLLPSHVVYLAIFPTGLSSTNFEYVFLFYLIIIWMDNVENWINSGNYSRLACDIQFVRSMGYYLIQIYIPSSLIVVISWVSFWLNRNASPARVSLGVTTVLTMTTLMSSTNAALPKISYVKSIDIYLGTCFVMVFASLLGNANNFRLFDLVSFRFIIYILWFELFWITSRLVDLFWCIYLGRSIPSSLFQSTVTTALDIQSIRNQGNS